jgi:CRISPR system Cascade subunit CasB
MTEAHPFITYLMGLHEDRAALAALRRGLGHSPGSVSEMYRYVVPWLPEGASGPREDTYFLIASLFAYHPDEGGGGNMGNHFARCLEPMLDSTAVERRFTALLAAHPDDLGIYLRQAVAFLKSKGVAVNWHQLFIDMLAWGHPDRYVQRRWARAFWGDAPVLPEI